MTTEGGLTEDAEPAPPNPYASPALVCDIPCDDDCDAVCHAGHDVTPKKPHPDFSCQANLPGKA